MSRGWLLLLAIAIAFGAQRSCQSREIVRLPGVLASEMPQQTELRRAEREPFEHRGYLLEPQARYELTARLLSRLEYRLGREAQLSPVDFALGWGPMSDSSVLAQLEISQSGRFFWVRWQEAPPVSQRVLFEHAANTHLIPADDTVRRALDRMRAGHVVHLEGLLVNVRAADGWRWKTSLVRDDMGAGACELFWVTQAWIEQEAET
ncbi:MAG TPA: hypothetical protein VGE57_02385 [Solimonas sp.]